VWKLLHAGQPTSSFSAPFAFDIKNPEQDPCIQGHKHHIPKLDFSRLGNTISGNNHFGLKERKMPGALTSAFTEIQKPS
jgi:hypothetical protein